MIIQLRIERAQHRDAGAQHVHGMRFLRHQPQRIQHLLGQVASESNFAGEFIELLDVGQFALGALGILKTGAAYLSLDLRFSLQRAPAAVFDGAVRLIIGDKRRLQGAAPQPLVLSIRSSIPDWGRPW